MMLLVMVSPVLVACGDDDDEPNKSGGVNVYGGKKLIELNVWQEEMNIPSCILLEYDSKGRLSQISSKDIERQYHDGEYNYSYTGNNSVLATIDYDIRVISYFKNSYSNTSVGFSLNNDGYIDQLGTCTLNYDTNGYLTGVEDNHGITTLAYNDNDLFKASMSPLTSGNIKLYYVTYGKKTDTGELYIHGKQDRDRYNRLSFDNRTVIAFIAYQVGLFGRVSKTFLNLRNKNETSAFIDCEDDYKTYSYKITYVCQ